MKGLLLVAVLSTALLLASCGGSSSTATPPAPPSVTVLPASATLNVNGTQQFTATVTNESSTLVNWQVNSVAGGNSTFGTISSGGLYTAPAKQPTSNIVTITAISQASSTVTNTAMVTIITTTINGITPNSTSGPVVVAAGATQPFAVTVSGSGTVAVTWEVTGPDGIAVVGGTSAIGKVTQQGNYIAPQIPPPGARVTVTAVSQADATQTASAVVQLTFSNFSIQGSYAFSMKGTNTTTGGYLLRAGSFTAASSSATTGGTLNSGLEDINQPSSQPNSSAATPFSGTYQVGPDGRGMMQFCENPAGNCIGIAVTATFRIVVVSAQQVQIIEFDSFATGAGEMDLQDTSAFIPGLSGTYSFDLSGISSVTGGTQNPGSWIGEFVTDGKGAISSGETDLNDGGSLTRPQVLSTSSYAAAASGRGTVTMNTSTRTFSLIFYVVSAGHVKFIESDALPAPALVGDAFKQQQTVPWATSSLTCSTVDCDFVFEVGGANSTGGVTGAGRFTADSNGNIVASSGLIDRNLNGIVTSGTLTGTYSIDANGRGVTTFTATLNGTPTTVSFVFYMISAGMALVQENEPGNAADGLLLLQQGGPFAAASLQGSYTLSLDGRTAGGRQGVVGQLAPDGKGNVGSGTLDINVNEVGAQKQLVGESVTGNYPPAFVTLTGRATMQLNPAADNRNFVLYFVNTAASPAQVFVMATDATRVAAGIMYKQF
jgi:hypothetical protein